MDATLSGRAPRPKINLDPVTPPARPFQGRRFSHVLPEMEATPLRRRQAEAGARENGMENRHRGFVASKHEPKTRERDNAIDVQANVAPSCRAPRPEVDPATQMARQSQRRRFSHAPPKNGAMLTNHHRVFVEIKQETGTRKRGDAPVTSFPRPQFFFHLNKHAMYGKTSRDGSSSPPQAAGQDDMDVEAPVQMSKSRVKRELEDEIGGPARRVKHGHPAVDIPSFDADFHDCLAPPRNSIGGGARNRAAKTTSGKNKRRRSAAAAEEKLASRRRFDQAREVHCCKADPADMVDMWVCAPSFDQQSGEVVPGVFHYLPVTLIQQSSKRERGGKVNWYVQPGGQDRHKEWNDEGGRVVWKVPAESLFPKAPAESGKGCKTCGEKKGQISWIPDEDEHICDSCADAPRRNLQWHYDSRDLGFERARACGCQGW